jgi:hypothetical protein
MRQKERIDMPIEVFGLKRLAMGKNLGMAAKAIDKKTGTGPGRPEE